MFLLHKGCQWNREVLESPSLKGFMGTWFSGGIGSAGEGLEYSRHSRIVVVRLAQTY